MSSCFFFVFFLSFTPFSCFFPSILFADVTYPFLVLFIVVIHHFIQGFGGGLQCRKTEAENLDDYTIESANSAEYRSDDG